MQRDLQNTRCGLHTRFRRRGAAGVGTEKARATEGHCTDITISILIDWWRGWSWRPHVTDNKQPSSSHHQSSTAGNVCCNWHTHTLSQDCFFLKFSNLLGGTEGFTFIEAFLCSNFQVTTQKSLEKNGTSPRVHSTTPSSRVPLVAQVLQSAMAASYHATH